jgi:methylated-DNA-[protein]-cysteine S-methyltransferase
MHECMLLTAVGPLVARADDEGLVQLGFARRAQAATGTGEVLVQAQRHPVLRAVQTQIGEYFAGTRRRFTVQLAMRGPAFHRKVWEALLDIPYGQTISYGELARRIGEPDAARAVGAANGANPIVIIVPCHRVIGADGRLVGYGGGLARKRILLDHEAGRLTLIPA